MLKLLAIGLCLYALPCNAYQLLSDEQAMVQQTKIAKDALDKAQEAYLSKYNNCIEKSKSNILNPIDFKNIKLNEKELKATVLYFSAKTHRACVGDLVDKYVTAINVARNFDVPDYSVKDDPKSENTLYLAAPLAIDQVKYLPDYLQIDKAKRDLIEKIPHIHQPFNITKSFNALNINTK